VSQIPGSVSTWGWCRACNSNVSGGLYPLESSVYADFPGAFRLGDNAARNLTVSGGLYPLESSVYADFPAKASTPERGNSPQREMLSEIHMSDVGRADDRMQLGPLYGQLYRACGIHPNSPRPPPTKSPVLVRVTKRLWVNPEFAQRLAIPIKSGMRRSVSQRSARQADKCRSLW
jgi:hypothetical protein